MNRHQDCAELLQYPLISDAARYAHVLLPDGRVRTFDARDPAPKPFRRIQANGVGNHCRWMLTDEALVVLRADGTYLAKPRPAELQFSGGDAYRTVFSFATRAADILVLSAHRRTFVVRVGGPALEEETLSLDGRCFDGCFLGAAGYMLVGQKRRTGEESPATPMVVSLQGEAVTATSLPSAINLRLDAVLAVLPAANSQLLVCAEAAPPPSMEDLEANDNLGASDHDHFWLIAQGEGRNDRAVRMENCRFLGRAGPHGGERAFLQLQEQGAERPSTATPAGMASIGADGAIARHEIAGLPRRSSVRRIQFDPRVGWFGIADEHSATRDRYMLSSLDGVAWRATRLLQEGKSSS
jgi:hypothetical protein